MYAVVVAIVSLLPSRLFDDVPSGGYGDKIVHFVMYGVYVALISWTLQPGKAKRWQTLTLIVFFCFFYGTLMELCQEVFRPGDRTFSIGDIAANAAGSTTVAALMMGSRHVRLLTSSRTRKDL